MLVFPYIHLLAALVGMDGCFIRLNRHILISKMAKPSKRQWMLISNSHTTWIRWFNWTRGLSVPTGLKTALGLPWTAWDCLGLVPFHFQIPTSHFPSTPHQFIKPRYVTVAHSFYLWFSFNFTHPGPERTKIGRLVQGEAFFRRLGGSTTLYSKLPAPRPNTTERLFSFWKSGFSGRHICLSGIFRSISKPSTYRRAPWLP